jgi:hypothetical protein
MGSLRTGWRVGAAIWVSAVALAACAGDEDGGQPAATNPSTSSPSPTSESQPRPDRPPAIAPYEPGSDEEYANGKRLAGRVAQRALTFARGATPREVAAALPPAAGMPRGRLARVLAPAVDPAAHSVAKVVYPQLSGVTESSLGAMVVVRQTMQPDDGPPRRVTRVLDVRLKLSAGRWSLDRIASIGGSPVPRPESPSRAARRVLDSPKINLSDSARWDIHRGAVDEALLTALAAVAERHGLSISVFKSGHPRNVWATVRPSAHSQGLAADIYAVDGRLVITQRLPDSGAYEVAGALAANGASQLGSPWVFGSGGPRSFTDTVHQDHIHVQQSPVS